MGEQVNAAAPQVEAIRGPVVTLDGVVVRRRGAAILGPVDIRIPTGGFVGVVGPNGAGKSTLLRVIAGQERPVEGRVSGLVGRDRKRRVGVLFQHHDFLPDLPFTVEDVVIFGRSAAAGFLRRLGRQDRDAVESAMGAFGLTEIRRRLYRELSGGERQKTHLARLVAQEAELILLDEPAAGLDLAWQERMTALVADVFRRGRSTIVMVTHEIDRLPECCTQALLMNRGLVMASGPPRTMFESRRMSGIYSCRMEVVERGGRFHAFSTGEEP